MVAQQQQDFLEAVLLGSGAAARPSRARACAPCARSVSARWQRRVIVLVRRRGRSSSSADGVQAVPATYGCFAIRASSLAMSSGERTKSTQPAATALRGIES